MMTSVPRGPCAAFAAPAPPGAAPPLGAGVSVAPAPPRPAPAPATAPARRFKTTCVEFAENANDWMSCHDLMTPVARFLSSTRVGTTGAFAPVPRAPCGCAPGCCVAGGFSGVVAAAGGVVAGGVAAGGVSGFGGVCGCVRVVGGFCPGGVVCCAGLAGGATSGAAGGTAVSPDGDGAFALPRPRPPRPPPLGSTWYAIHFESAENTAPLAFGTSVCWFVSTRTIWSTGLASVGMVLASDWTEATPLPSPEISWPVIVRHLV